MARGRAEDGLAAAASSKAGRPRSQFGQQDVPYDYYDVEQYGTLVDDCAPQALCPQDSTTADSGLELVASEDQVACAPAICYPFLTVEGHRVWLPIPGHDHLFSQQAQYSHSAKPTPDPRSPTEAHQQGAALTEEPNRTDDFVSHVPVDHGVAPGRPRKTVSRKHATPRTRGVKRSRSSTRARVRQDDGEEDEDGASSNTIASIATNCLYMGDFEALIHFYTVRLKELDTNPLRPIVTEWIKIREPNRSSKYGGYTNKLPVHMEPRSCPPWWPDNVIYREPSHLKTHELLKVAVDMMLLHRKIDEETQKPRAGWMLKLRKAAEYQLTMTPVEKFTAGKSPGYNEAMKERATEILRDLFEVAQSHEDHLAQYNLYEGTGNEDPGCGKQHTWSRIPKRSRPPQRTMKRVKTASKCIRDSIPESSDEETESDEPLVTSSQTKDLSTQSAQQHLPLLEPPTTPQTPDTLASSQQLGVSNSALHPPSPGMHYHPRPFAPQTSVDRPSLSFDQSMDGLLPNDAQDGTPQSVTFINTPQASKWLQSMPRVLCPFPGQEQSHFCPASGPSPNGYHVLDTLQGIPNTVSVIGPTYPTQPRHTALQSMEDRSFASYPSGLAQQVHARAPNVPPASPMDSEIQAASSFGSVQSDVDMTSPDVHQMQYRPYPHGLPHQVQGYTSNASGSPVDSKVSITSYNSSFDPVRSDVDMTSQDMHPMPYQSNDQNPYHGFPY